jgi:hypothetical protein
VKLCRIIENFILSSVILSSVILWRLDCTGFFSFFYKLLFLFLLAKFFLFFPYLVKFGFSGCRNSYRGLMQSPPGATCSSPEPCWLLTYFSRPFCSKDLVLDNYFWCKVALNCQKNITGCFRLNHGNFYILHCTSQ